MRRSTLLTQVLAVNGALVGVTALVAAMVARDRLPGLADPDGLLVLALTVSSAILLNSLLLRARLEPIDRLVQAMARVDLARPGMRARTPRSAAREVQDLGTTFNRMLDRIEDERRDAGRAVLRAQEEERSRIAQDLHDEVNQALTAILLRLSATMSDAPHGLRAELHETQQLVTQAMDELLTLARQLRPTALDDHGLIPALASQVADFGRRTGVQVGFRHTGTPPVLSDEEQLVIYRVTQESLSNIAQHARAATVDVELCFVGRIVLRIRDDGDGFDASPARRSHGRVRGRPGGLGLSGMRERALLVGGRLEIFSAPGAGTTIELTMGAT
ncbi:MAG TPA: HAMP domain-containing sensor histidine kinase [Solirubrobacteraceae bacterium]|nr:HAMP domain-containing sensor histidine kinase [Solirubrobacteraceae bacterium]